MPSYSLTLVTILVWTKQSFSAVMQWHKKWKTGGVYIAKFPNTYSSCGD